MRCLVVANRTLGCEHLVELLEERLSSGPCSIHVLVPATADPHGWTHDEASDHVIAQERLDTALERFGRLDPDVTGEIGDPRPVDAIRDVLRREEFDEVIVSTLPAGASRWLRMDAVSRLQRTVDVPVTHVVAPEDVDASR
jgi:hypothetical protein